MLVMSVHRLPFLRVCFLILSLALSQSLCADDGHSLHLYSNGCTDYSPYVDRLADMTEEVVATMGYVVGLLYAIAALLVIYNAMIIYIKLNTGEGEFTKSVLTMFGAIFFLIGATMVLPSFFGYKAHGSTGGLFNFLGF